MRDGCGAVTQRAAKALRRVIAEMRLRIPRTASLFAATWKRELAKLDHRERGRILRLLEEHPERAIAWVLAAEMRTVNSLRPGDPEL